MHAEKALLLLQSVIVPYEKLNEVELPEYANAKDNCTSSFARVLLACGKLLSPEKFFEAFEFLVTRLPLMADRVEAPIAQGMLTDIVQTYVSAKSIAFDKVLTYRIDMRRQ